MKLTIAGTSTGKININIILVVAYKSFSLAPAYFYEIFRNNRRRFRQISIFIRTYDRLREEVDFAFIRDIMLLNPDILAFSNFFWNYEENLKLAKLARDLKGNIRTIFGGPQIGDFSDALEIISNHDQIDYLLCGEADFTFPELCLSIQKNHQPKNIQGLLYRAGNEFINTDEIYHVRDLRNLPVVYNPQSEYVLANFNKHRALPLETIRGCRSQCSYCQYCLNSLRYKPLKAVESEIRFLCENQAQYVRVCDSHFGGSRARAFEIFDMINHFNDRNTTFYIYPDPDHVDSEYLDKAKRSNCRIISLGIETLDIDVAKKISRRVSIPRSIEALSLMSENNIRPQVDLILGLPGQTAESFVDDIQSLMADGHDEILFSPLMLFPGTRLNKEKESLGLKRLDTGQNFALNESLNKQEYAFALNAIEMNFLLKNMRLVQKYIHDKYFRQMNHREFFGNLFAFDFLSDCPGLNQLTEWFGMGSKFIRGRLADLISTVVKLLEGAFKLGLNDDPYIREIIRYELHGIAMKLRYREIGEDIYGRRPIIEIISGDEIRSMKLQINPKCWLETYHFPAELAEKRKDGRRSKSSNTFCALVCDQNKSYALSGDEFDLLVKFTTPAKLEDLNDSGEVPESQIMKWLKAGVLASVNQ
jgi:radical SAM superfamily enzyme YgiQ (UPF0313 family)